MPRIVVFGNSASGKSTYAKQVAREYGCALLDLDTLAWHADRVPPTRRPADACACEIRAFIAGRDAWVVEGCYADLLAAAVSHATELVFLNPGTATCIANARRRPWEPHKYASAQEQDANLPMLIAWIEQYEQRQDVFSLKAHRELFDGFPGGKREYNSNGGR